ncbi:MAG: OmpA family protein [Gallionellaceae bacterium]
MKKLVISVLLVNLLAACASQPEKVADTNASKAKPAPAAQPATTAPQVDPLNDPNNSLLALRSVYYPLDISAVQDADKPAVQAHGMYLGGHAARNVRLEGNCDERGSNEYNLALGQRRAEGVSKMLQAAGANPSQIQTVSYGEEKPSGTAHNEAAWQQNRRTDLNYSGK